MSGWVKVKVPAPVSAPAETRPCVNSSGAVPKIERTSVPQKWIVEKLAMGSVPYVSRLAKEMGQRIAAGDRAMKRLDEVTS